MGMPARTGIVGVDIACREFDARNIYVDIIETLVLTEIDEKITMHWELHRKSASFASSL